MKIEYNKVHNIIAVEDDDGSKAIIIHCLKTTRNNTSDKLDNKFEIAEKVLLKIQKIIYEAKKEC